MRILIIDNSQTFCRTLKEMIEQDYGYAVTCHTSLEMGMRENCGEYDLIILDCKFGPGTCGLDALKKLRADGVTTKIIFVSGYDDYEKPSLEAGADMFIKKACIYPGLCEILGEKRNALHP